MRLLTWNINSLRLRLPLLERIIHETGPDIVCLQETKVSDPLFPHAEIEALGYPWRLAKGMKSYNGVAILSRIPLHPVPKLPDWCGKQDCRHIAGDLQINNRTLRVHNFYVPAGGDIPNPQENPKFAHKLNFIEEAEKFFSKNPPLSTILVGDLNVAPLEKDVWNHQLLLKIVSHTPPECERHLRWQNTGFIDAIRHCFPEPEKIFTWWSYRNRDWKKSNRGRRLDHIWITPDLLASLQKINILREARNAERPSDHVPVTIDLNLS